MTSNYVEIRNVTKRFEKFTALKNVSLDIREGEFVCFLGPSGCGKTTLLRAIAGLDIQTEGVIRQSGRDVSALPPEQRDFGIVFQSYALFPNLTVRDNIGFGLKTRGMDRAKIKARVDELLEMIGLPDKGNSFPSQISGGQQQRVALARALAPGPGLILLDEPLSALDAKVRVHLRQQLKQLQRQLGVTTIMVTHDQDEALSLADRIVVMNVGVVDQVGTPDEIYDQPATRFVADFIGAMNFFDGVMAAPDAVRVRDLRLTCMTNGKKADEDVTLAIRPEDVQFVEGSDDGAPNVFEAHVADLEFLGSHSRAHLEHDAFHSTPLTAQLSQTELRRRALRRGERVKVKLPEDRLRVYQRTPHHG